MGAIKGFFVGKDGQVQTYWTNEVISDPVVPTPDLWAKEQVILDGTMPKQRTVLGTLDKYTRHGRFDIATLQKDQRFWQGVREKRAARAGKTPETPTQKDNHGLGKH